MSLSSNLTKRKKFLKITPLTMILLLATGCQKNESNNQVIESEPLQTTSQKLMESTTTTESYEVSSTTVKSSATASSTETNTSSESKPAFQTITNAEAQDSSKIVKSLWEQASRIARKIYLQMGDISAIVKIYNNLGLYNQPFKNNEFPEKIREFTTHYGEANKDDLALLIGTEEYDNILGTNFSGLNPSGEFNKASQATVNKPQNAGTSNNSKVTSKENFEPLSPSDSDAFNKADKIIMDKANRMIHKIYLQIGDTTALLDIYNNLGLYHQPFKDYEFPDKIRQHPVFGDETAMSIGTEEYDDMMGTNFSGFNPNGEFSKAKR